MAVRNEFSCASTGCARWTRSPTLGRGYTRIAPLLALAAFALAGCNANQAVNPSSVSQQNLGNIYPNYNPYNPIQYAQSSGFYGGR